MSKRLPSRDAQGRFRKPKKSSYGKRSRVRQNPRKR